MPLVEIKGMKRHYEMASETVKALDGIDLNIEKGERILLLGPSGSGKTTLLNCIAALDNPTEGNYMFSGEEVPKKHSEKKFFLPSLSFFLSCCACSLSTP